MCRHKVASIANVCPLLPSTCLPLLIEFQKDVFYVTSTDGIDCLVQIIVAKGYSKKKVRAVLIALRALNACYQCIWVDSGGIHKSFVFFLGEAI